MKTMIVPKKCKTSLRRTKYSNDRYIECVCTALKIQETTKIINRNIHNTRIQSNNLNLRPSRAIALGIPPDCMILNLERPVQRLLPGLQTRRDALYDCVEGPVVEEGAGVPVFLAEGADHAVHGGFVAVVGPAFCVVLVLISIAGLAGYRYV